MAKVLEFQLQRQPCQRIFRTDLLWDGLVGSPCSPRDSPESSPTVEHHSSKASILQCSAFFIVQLSHPYTTTGKTVTLTIWTFSVMSLLFHVLSRLVRAFLPRSERLLSSWLQSLVRHCKQKGGQGQGFVSCRIPVRSPAPPPLFRPRVGPASIRDPPPPGSGDYTVGDREAQFPFKEGPAARLQGRSGQPASSHQPLQGQPCWCSRPSPPAHILGPTGWVLSTQPF